MSSFHEYLNTTMQILGSEYTNVHVNRAIMFFYTLSVATNGRRPSNLVGRFGINLLRAFGAVGFCVPLILGKLPSDIFRGVDEYVYLVAAAMIVEAIPYEKYTPAFVDIALLKCQEFSYAIVKGNACAMGFVALQQLTPNSLIAPLIGGYIAVNGDRLLENGLASLNGRGANDSDSKLAVCGSVLYMLLTNDCFGYLSLGLSLLAVRVWLVIFRISCDYCDYDALQKKVMTRVNATLSRNAKIIAAGSPKRGRGRKASPKNK